MEIKGFSDFRFVCTFLIQCSHTWLLGSKILSDELLLDLFERIDVDLYRGFLQLNGHFNQLIRKYSNLSLTLDRDDYYSNH